MPMGLMASILVVWSIFLGLGAYYKGRDSRADEVAQYQAAIDRANSEAREAELRASKASARVVTEYRDRIKVIREQAPSRIELVEVVKREVDSDCMLPPSFIRLWDGEPSSSAPGENPERVDGASRSLADLPEQIRKAREAHEINSARLSAWQSLATQNGWEIVD